MKKLFCLLTSVICMSCTVNRGGLADNELSQKQIDSIVYADRSIDSLVVVLGRFESQENRPGIVAACRELGRSYRNASMFSEAVDIHKKGLAHAREICDTIQIIQALNNLGTDYRRMSILDEASDYHYQALAVSEAYSDQTSSVALKNRVVSLNGIGNVQLSLGNSVEAERVFREALKGETKLESYLGQAINYANIGAILEGNGQIDSARYYYGLSLDCNVKTGSDLGISLCHTHFGRLHENEGNYDRAVQEYSKAYQIMSGKKDKWHWLESCLSLSRVYAVQGKLPLSRKFLSEAKEVAQKINSTGHLADVYLQEYKIEVSAGNHKKALEAYKKSSEYSSQFANEKNLTHMQNVRVRYEREKKQAEIDMIHQNYNAEKRNRSIILISIIVAFVLAVIAILFLIHIVHLSSKNKKVMKEAERTRTNFFTNITHEFRTPLTIIISAANDILTKNKADKSLCRDSVDIIRHGKGLLDLVNQILDIAKMSSGVAQTPSWKRGDVIGFITMICEGHLKYAERKDLRINYGFDTDSLVMDFIPSYLTRIIQNLLSNAIKFSDPGSDIFVSAKVVSSAKENHLQLYVCDTGSGMNEEQKEHIFLPFYQAHDDTDNIGSGIGLSLVKLTAEAMGGKVDVHSHPSEGSVFIVTLPVTNTRDNLEYVAPEQFDMDFNDELYIQQYPEDEDDGNASTPRILIVEDTPEVARWQMRQLNPEYNFYFAADGKEGLQKTTDIMPDLIITDVMMPVMDGYEMLRRIRTDDMLCHIPVIMVTAKATAEDKIKGLNLGADAYMEKPFNPEELSVRVSRLLEQREMLRKKFQDPSEDDTVPAQHLSAADRAFVEKLSDTVHAQIENGQIDYDLLASAFFVGKTQLNRKIKAVTGYTTTEYILQVKISMAKHLLMKTDFPIGQIASRCGIDDVAYFSSVFRKCVGKTPSAYRNR